MLLRQDCPLHSIKINYTLRLLSLCQELYRLSVIGDEKKILLLRVGSNLGHCCLKHNSESLLRKKETILVAERSKASVCGPSLDGTAGSNPANVVDVCLLRLWYVVRYSLCDRPITRPEESYRVCVCDTVSVTGRSLIQRSPTECV